MNKKGWQFILAVLCFIGVAVLVVIGVKRASRSDLVEGLESLGQKTFEAYNTKTEEEDGETTYIVFYRYIDPKYGEIVFSPGVDKAEFDSCRYSLVNYETYHEMYPDTVKKPTIDRYVYVYPLNGKTESIIEDQPYSLYEVSKLIDPTPTVSATYYYIFAGILLLAGAYLLFLVFVPKCSKER